MIYEFNGYKPVVHESAFIHELAAVTGNVIIGEKVYVGPGAAIRGDWGEIVIEDGCNVQENCTIHVFPGKSVLLKAGAHIGHGAVIHGGNIGRRIAKISICTCLPPPEPPYYNGGGLRPPLWIPLWSKLI